MDMNWRTKKDIVENSETYTQWFKIILGKYFFLYGYLSIWF